MNDCDWYAGKDAEDALKGMAENLGCADVDECRDEYCVDGPIVELSEESLDKLTFLDEDGAEEGIEPARRSFREQLAKMIANGCKFPCMFASTEY